MRKYPKWILIGMPVLVLSCLFLYVTVNFQTGSTTLTWTAPTENEYNESLTDLIGYNIHCWADGGKYANTIYVDNPDVTSYVIENLSPGTYVCAISAVRADGLESALSNVVTKIVP